MTDKRFTLTTTEFDGTLSFYDAIYDCETRMSTEYVLNAVETTLNQLADENENNKKLIKLAYDDNNRLRNKNKRLHKYFDKIWELCKEHFTDEEIIKELDR